MATTKTFLLLAAALLVLAVAIALVADAPIRAQRVIGSANIAFVPNATMGFIAVGLSVAACLSLLSAAVLASPNGTTPYE